MIRSMPLFSAVALTAPTSPKREAVRPPEAVEAPSQDPFNRMLAQQREAARLSSKVPVQTQSPAPVQPPAEAPAPEPQASAAASKEKESSGSGATAGSPPPQSIRSANRSSLQPAGSGDKPAEIDPEPPVSEARHGRKTPGPEAEQLAKLFKTPPKNQTPKLPPIGPEDEPEPAPIAPPQTVPVTPSPIHPGPPVIECPVEPMLAQQAWPEHAASLAAAKEENGTQALQNRDADSLSKTSGGTDLAPGAGTGTGNGPALAPALAAGSATADAFAATTKIAERADLAATAGPAPGGAATASAPTAAPAHLAQAPQGTPTSTVPALSSTQLATLDAQPGTEAFAMKFSAQVAVWVREGVHEAQLQLNPADMGPVRVAILLEGAAAQVNFTAEHALTRQALEQALPTLAGNLAEAGFTLAGGGVFDQPQQPERSAGEDSARSLARAQPTDVDSAGEPVRAAVARPRGVVDLVA